MALALLWLALTLAAGMDTQQPPSPQLIQKVEGSLNLQKCFGKHAKLRREYSFVGWTDGMRQKVDRNRIEFWVAESDNHARKPGLFIEFLRLPTLDDSDFKFITGVYDVTKGRVTSGGCFNNNPVR